MTTITITRPRIINAIPCARNADDAAYIINRFRNDDAFNDEFLDAILSSSDNPAIEDIIRMLMTDTALFNEILLSFDICPIHECDIEICIDDNDQECADIRN